MIPFERNLLDTLPALLWPVTRRESLSSAPMDVVETADGYRVTVTVDGKSDSGIADGSPDACSVLKLANLAGVQVPR